MSVLPAGRTPAERTSEEAGRTSEGAEAEWVRWRRAGDRLALDPQVVAHQAAQIGQNRAQILPGLGVGHLAPQERGKRVAAMGRSLRCAVGGNGQS